MALRHVGRCIRYFSLVVVAGWFVTGCVIKEPPAITANWRRTEGAGRIREEW